MKKLTKAEINQLILLQQRAIEHDQLSTHYHNAVAQDVPTSKVDLTLDERGNRYGDFSDHARIAQALQDTMRQHKARQIPNPKADDELDWFTPWDLLTPVAKQALTVIADKIARILNGDPNYADNWHDIQGYAKLVEDRLPKSE